MTDEAAIILRAAAEVRAEFGRRVGPTGGLTVHQAILLGVICASPGVTQRALCVQSGVDRSTMNTMLHYMKSRGLLTISRSEEDTRATLVRATDAGLEANKQARKTLAATSISLMNRTKPEVRAKFAQALQQIVGGAE